MADVLSRMVEQKVRDPKIEGIRPKISCPEIHHLYFVDDSLFITKGSVENAQALKSTLDKYCRASSQKVNFTKSTIYCGAYSDEQTAIEVAMVFGMSSARYLGKYLSFPSMWGK